MMLGVINKLEKAVRFRGAISGIDTGFSDLNNVLDGIQNEYIILGARASIGKTALAVNIAKNMVRKNIPVGYFSLEMSGESLMMRMLSDETTVQARILRSGMIGDSQLKSINNKGCDMAEYPLYVMDKTRGELTKIISKSRYMVRVMGVKCLFIDHASLIRHPDRKMKRYEQFSEISNEIQALQRELNVPIILLAQLGRESEGKNPTLADLRESGGFEQDADTVMLMHRERKLPEGARFIETDIDIAKNRNGACGVVKLLFFPEYIRFANMERGNQ
jgi:replicative DNA helicase